MFDVSHDLEVEHCSGEITRTHSEEEFEYLEKSLIEHCETFVYYLITVLHIAAVT
jgi:hypothetical protein